MNSPVVAMTYASLVDRYGPGEVLTAGELPTPVVTASLLIDERTIEKAARVSYAGEPTKNSATSGGFLPVKFTLTTSGPNGNNQFFVDDDLALEEVYKSPINEAINQDHKKTFRAVVGEIRESEYIKELVTLKEGGCLSGVKCRGAIFEKQYPKVAFKVREGAGKWAAVSMEALGNPLEKVGKYLVIHKPKFVGAGLVRFPANQHSLIHEVGKMENEIPGEGQIREASLAEILALGLDKALGQS